MKMKFIPPVFIDVPSHINESSSTKTVEELVRILNKFERGYGITEADIVLEVNRGEISAESITDESILSETKYDFLISDDSVIYLLQTRYRVNERHARSLL